MKEIWLEILSQVCECAKILLIYKCILCGKVERDPRKYLIMLCGLATVDLCCFALHIEIDAIVVMALRVVICLFLVQDRRGNGLVGILYALIVIDTIDTFLFIPKHFLGMKETIEGEIWLILLGTVAYGLFCAVYYKTYNKRNYIFEHYRIKDIIILVALFWCCIFVSGGAGLILLQDIGRELLVPIACMMELTCIILVIISLLQIIVDKEKSDYKELLINREQYHNMRYQYYREQERYYDEMHKFRHDEKKHLQTIYQYCGNGDCEGAMRYIRQINDEILSEIHILDCGNRTISSILNYYNAKSEEQNISFHVEGHISDQVEILDVDLCTMLANIMENAYEACMKVGDGAFICVSLKQDNMLYIKVENSAVEEKAGDNYSLRTQKGKGHGIGMKNVCNVVDKYEGMIMWRLENHIFTTEIII